MAAIATSDGMSLGNGAAPRTGPRRGHVEALWDMPLGPYNSEGASIDREAACGEWTEDNQSGCAEESEGFFSGLSMFE